MSGMTSTTKEESGALPKEAQGQSYLDDRSQESDLGAGFKRPKHVHLLGAGGAGVSGIGRILAGLGVEISGHDCQSSDSFDKLRATGLKLELGPSEARYLPAGADLVVRSAAVPADDPQVLAAESRGVEVLKYADALARIAPAGRTLAVAGTHGKTTASWMLWHALEAIEEGRRGPVPGALVGGINRRLETNALAGGAGAWFCAEACEYDRTFLGLNPAGAVITNIEADHLDYYGDLAAIHKAFARFACQVDADGLLVLGSDVTEEVELGAPCQVLRLGRELRVDLRGEDRGNFRFRLRAPKWVSPEVQLSVPGHFNVENAALVLALATGMVSRRLGLDPNKVAAYAAKGLENFRGVARRFEPWGAVDGVQLVHDYAHHPTEVRVTLEAALRAFPGRPLHVLFQPHQHSRTARFLEEFADSLRSADRVVVTDVYGARVHSDGAVYAGASELVDALKARQVDAVVGGGLSDSVDAFVEALPSRAAGFVLGAGDIETVHDDLHKKLALRGAPPGEPLL
ncbi:MAG: UDP-N-acetylmuramate--alanine ligase [Planctomycetota bacterium]|jgi:UDP-N-acetylmuramate--alanine ligase